MYEEKSCLSATTFGPKRNDVKMELDLSLGRHGGITEDHLDKVRKNGILGRNVIRGNSSSGGSGSAGEDSSSDEPVPVPSRRRHSLPPKKYRLKDTSTTVNLQSVKLPNVFPFAEHENGKEGDEPGNLDDVTPDDDDCSQKDGDGLQHSFASAGENSDCDMGGYCDGDESSKQDGDDALKKFFECDVCSMKFSNGANMRRHRMRHTGVKPFECRVCQKRFFRKDHLAEHMATHSKLLPFRCPICNKGFQRQIAMRAHFQNAHVGGSHDIVKACPLCTYKSGSMKSLRCHFYSRHGIDLDNPLPHSPSLQSAGTTNGGASPDSCPSGSGSGEYSELAHALGFEDRDKITDSTLIPSHFLVPQIEITSNSHFSETFPFMADSSYDCPQRKRHRHHSNDSSSPKNISPKSDSSSNIPSSSDLVVVKREILEVDDNYKDTPEQSITSGSSADEAKRKPSPDMLTVQDGPEDLSPAGQSKPSFRLKLNPSSVKISPLKSLLGDDRKKDSYSTYSRLLGVTTNTSSVGTTTSRNSTAHSLRSGHTVPEGEAMSSSGGSLTLNSLPGRKELSLQNSIHQCVYCKISFPNITLYFLHKGGCPALPLPEEVEYSLQLVEDGGQGAENDETTAAQQQGPMTTQATAGPPVLRTRSLLPTGRSRVGKRRLDEFEQQLLRLIGPSVPEEDEEETFGKSVAQKLRRLDRRTSLDIQLKVNQLLYEAEIQILNAES